MSNKKSFSVDDIHKMRNEHYEKTKNMSDEDLIESINEEANEVLRDLEEIKDKKIAI